MHKKIGRFFLFLGLVLFCPCLLCSAQPVNAWTNPASAHWEAPFWSLNTLPNSSQSVMITNVGFKSVGIFSSTITGFSNSLTIGNLDLYAPTNSLNTLLLNFVGASVPLHVLNGVLIGTNGILMNLYSGLQVDGTSGGQLSVQSGKLIEEGGTLLATNVLTTVAFGGTMELTNALTALGPLVIDGLGTNVGTVTQSGGQMTCDLSLKTGTYNFLSGNFFGACSVVAAYTGGFNQSGGTNFAAITLGHSSYLNLANVGFYTLQEGAVISSTVELGPRSYSVGEFDQAGGSATIQTLTLGSGGFGGVNGLGVYSLTNGTLFTKAIDFVNGYIQQAGGQHTASNGWAMVGNPDHTAPRSVSYSLWNGNLICLSINIDFGTFTQAGGTNSIAQDLFFQNSSYTLSGGVLLTSNTTVAFGNFIDRGGLRMGSQFFQSGGQHRVSNTLSNLDQYILTGGSLVATQIVLRGTLTVSNSAVILNSGLFDLGGSLQLFGTTVQNLGAAALSENSLIDFEAGNHTLTFSNSSMIAWNNAGTLSLTNWQGSTNGGGSDQLFFGHSAAGLTSSQLNQIQFVNPIGFPPGRYRAQILATGEVVPALQPLLMLSRSQNNLILTWTGTSRLQSSTNIQGPYSDVIGATSPYSNIDFQLPAQFFRLRQ